NEDGRAAFIVPSEFLNSDYGKIVKDYLIKSKSLRHIIIFDSKKNIFDDALTTSAIILLEKNFKSSKVSFSNIKTLSQLEQYPDVPIVEFETTQLDSKIKWRAYYKKQESINFIDLIPFSSVAKVVRGIATGSNEYFVFNKSKAKKYNIPNECLLPCITRSKDIKLSFFFNEDLDVLKNADANIFLLDARKCQTDNNIKKYIEIGEKKEINKKYLTSKRSPWFSLENREPSPIWVGVFNRNGLKFIRNEANVLNLTTFHCIYHNAKLFNSFNIDLLFAYLLTDVAKKIFNDNRREYGDGLRKFEPNDLNNALMLDLSKLDKAAESKIINLYYDFRETVIIKKPVLGYVEEINSILVTKYKA
ncbi:MAG TPA: Eco57I restriction-modification methylase domain-containing protein, partial [Candidatus Kapabacteria bacterium]|nr:Eco57I restriction-modification methylase domain-containing protein [Candidatus Kapabacteria bacterium]